MLIRIGHEYHVMSELVAVVLNPGSLHVKKLRQEAMEKGCLIDATAGRKTRSVIILTTNQVGLSSLQTTTFKTRAEVKKVILVNIGYESFLKLDILAYILEPNSSPVKKLRHDAQEKGLLINATSGHKTRSVIVLSTGQIVLSSIQTTTLAGRVEIIQRRQADNEDDSLF